MADLRPPSPSTRMEGDLSAVTTRPSSPADTLQNTINEKEELKKSASNNAATRVTSKTDTTNIDPAELEVNDRYIEGYKLWLVHSGFLAAVLLFALDQTIVSTALPVLASKFNALDNLTWVVSAYFLTQAGLMLTFGQILTITSNKYVFIVCISLFEIGSLICGVAPSMNVLIFGRAFQGVGASGQFISILTLLSQVARLEIRPLLFGTFGGVFALASVIGPLLGGVFTDRVSWRWCFYINLPFGGVALFLVWWFLPNHPPLRNPLYEGMSTTQKWLALDWVGSALSLAMITCLLLPLQWGGVTRPWNDRVVIALFCTFGVLLILFVTWEYRKGKRAMLPLELFRRRTQIGASGATFFMMIAFLSASYYLPFFYQAKGRTAQQSGIDIIPFMLGAVVASFGSGGLVNGTGHYLTWLIIGPLIGAVGAGLLFTIDETTKNAKIIGYQIVFGFGLGLAFQLPVMAIQAEYAHKPEKIPQASSLLTFFQLLGGVIGIAIAGTIFNNQLGKNLSSLATPLDPGTLKAVKQSVTIIFTLPQDQQAPVIHSYVKALDYIFILSVPVSVFTSIVALLIKNWNTKKRAAGPGAAVAV